MLQTLGTSSVIGLLHEAGESELPDGKGGKKMFDTQACWRLVVSARGILRAEGFRYAFDNGAWTSFQRGEPSHVAAFERLAGRITL
jgi:hypothetical protein